MDRTQTDKIVDQETNRLWRRLEALGDKYPSTVFDHPRMVGFVAKCWDTLDKKLGQRPISRMQIQSTCQRCYSTIHRRLEEARDEARRQAGAPNP